MTTTFLNKKGNNNNFNFNTYDFLNPYYEKISKKKDDNYIDNLLTKAFKNLVPWAKKEDKKDNIYIIFGDEPTKKYTFEKPSFTITNISPTSLNLEWNKAATHLLECTYYANNPTYDFIICDTPIKIHGNYIQVGSEIIPTFTRSDFFTTMKKEDQINIYNIAVEINAIFAA